MTPKIVQPNDIAEHYLNQIIDPAKRSMMLRFCISGLRPLIPENK